MKKVFFYGTAGITAMLMALMLVGIGYLMLKPLTNPYAYHSLGILAITGVATLVCGLAGFAFRCVEDAKEKGE